MTKKEFDSLHTGDIVKHELHDRTFVVTGNYGDHVTAVASVDITNHTEWKLIIKN